jgi:thioredoxin reductase (NADPH)
MKITVIETEAQVREAIKTHPQLVVDFFSTECPPCEKLAPIFERMADRFPEVHFTKIFRQPVKPFAQSLGVSGSPTLLFYKNGQLQEKRFSGEISETELTEYLNSIFPSSNPVEPKSDKNEILETRDLCIIGSGPAGLTAAVYAARYGIDQVVVGELDGGLMTSSHKICNYPSETEISGMALTQKMVDHVVQLGVPRINESAASIKEVGGFYEIKLSGGQTVRAKTVLLATGTKHRHLGLPNEKKLGGRGVSYCATCDAMFFKNKKVAVVGGGDSANTASLYLAEIAESVTQIYRGNALKGETAWIDQIQKHPKIKVLFGTNIVELLGESRLEGIRLDKPADGQDTLKVDGLFVEIGSDPDQTLIGQLGLKTDARGLIETQADQKTSRGGVWAAGDITTGSDGFRQIITAASEGAIAAQGIFKHLQKNHNS